MARLLIFVCLLVAAAARNIPASDYEPTKEQLELIFGKETQDQTKSTAARTPALVPDESVYFEKNIKPSQKNSKNMTPQTVELNIKIKVNDCDSKIVFIDDNVEVNNKNKGLASEGTKTVQQNAGKGVPVVHSRIVEDLTNAGDRVFLRGDECPDGKKRLGEKCVVPD